MMPLVGEGIRLGLRQYLCWACTYGTRPILARVDGSERIPRDMVSAIMIMPAILNSCVSFSIRWISLSSYSPPHHSRIHSVVVAKR